MGLFDRLRGDEAPRVAFIGIDGVPYSLLSDNVDDFENLARLAEEGTAGPIQSIVPPESSACWPALTTGKNPGETGVYGFQDREAGSYDTYVPMGRDVQATRLWDRVQQAGRDATVMNVPVTFPPQRNVQRMVSGFLSPSVEKAAYPDEFGEHLHSLEYPIDVDASLGHSDKSAFIENAHQTLDRRMDAFREYVKQDDWDLFFGVFMATDRVNHFLFRDYADDGKYADEFVDFYRQLDSHLGELRELLDDDVTLIVAADHGFTSLDYEVNCNAWLREAGWLTFDEFDHRLQLNALLREMDQQSPDAAVSTEEVVEAADIDAPVEDGAIVLESETRAAEIADELESRDRLIIEADGAAITIATVIDTDIVIAESEGEKDRSNSEPDQEHDMVEPTGPTGPDGTDHAVHSARVEPDVVGASGSAHAVDDPAGLATDTSAHSPTVTAEDATTATVIVKSESVRDDIVAQLEDATPAALGGDRADRTQLVDSVDVSETEQFYHITIVAASGTEFGTAMETDTAVLEYPHDELADIADDTRAYSLIPGRFYLNLDGREPRGSVPESEYESSRQSLADDLRALEGPNGKPVAERVLTKEETFRGDHDEIAPDLVVIPTAGFDLKAGFKGRKDPFVEAGARNGMHSFDNAACFIDDPAADLGDVDLYDLAPTILDAMDIEFERSDFDGASVL